MCNQQGHIESQEAVLPPPAAPRAPAALRPGGRAEELAKSVAAAPTRPELPSPAPLPPVQPAVQAEVRKALAEPAQPEPPAHEVAPKGLTFRIKLSEFKGHQQRNLNRILGDHMVVRGLGLIEFKREGGELVVTLPVGATNKEMQVISALQSHLNR